MQTVGPATSDVNIAPASAMHYGRIVALLEAAFLPTEDLRENVMSDFLVAHDGYGNAIGAIGVERYGGDALLRSLVVAPDFRNFGVGAQLVVELEARCRSLAVTDLFLLTTSARDFFARLRYRAIGRDCVPGALRAATEFTRLCPDSAVCMTKSL